ncbi:MAG TPA: PilW family protein [Cellvibrionaceae bacterium]
MIIKFYYSKFSRGFSLIELMVAMLIGVLVLAGVIQVVLNSKRSFMDNQETAFIQDNTRYAMDIIAKDFRAAGYKGCARNEPNIVNVVNSDVAASIEGAFDFNTKPVSGKESTSKADFKDDKLTFLPANALPDSITLRTVANENEATLRSHNPASKTITTWQTAEYSAGTPLMIVDANCQNIALLLANAAEDEEAASSEASTEIKYTNKNCGDGGLISIEEFDCSSGGKTNKVKSLSPGSKIFPYVVNTYFIGKSNAAINETMPALKREYLRMEKGVPTYSTEEIAQGVEDMQITYGLDEDRNGTVDEDKFIKASEVTAAQWSRVIAIHIELTLRSNLPVNAAVGDDGGFLRKKVASTISLRNLDTSS